jgi:hypothetical protein
VDSYFTEGQRNTRFLGEEVIQYHRTLTTYTSTLLKQGFKIMNAREPMPDPVMRRKFRKMQNELHRPMMFAYFSGEVNSSLRQESFMSDKS